MVNSLSDGTVTLKLGGILILRWFVSSDRSGARRSLPTRPALTAILTFAVTAARFAQRGIS